MTRFLTGKTQNSALLWAAYDPDAICTAPAVCDRRFAAYVAPHKSQDLARAALIDAGCEPASIIPEPERGRKRGR